MSNNSPAKSATENQAHPEAESFEEKANKKYIAFLLDRLKKQETEISRLEQVVEGYQEFYEDSPCGYITSTALGKVVHSNNTFAKYLGADAHDVVGGNLSQWNANKDSFYLHCRKCNSDKNGMAISELEFIGSDNNSVFLSIISKIFVKGSTPSDSLIRSTVVDITDHALLERDLIKNQQELFYARRKAEESDRLKSSFLANMSHEIRTPINGILGIHGLLKRKNLSEEKRLEYTEVLGQSATRLLDTVNDILEISIIESGRQINAPDTFNLDSFMDDLIAPFIVEAEAKGLRLRLVKDFETEDSQTHLDRSKLASIFSNLIKNAIKFTHKGFIEVTVKKENDKITGIVKDTGVGVSETEQITLFERFSKHLGDATNKYEGTGLGLAISRSNAKLLNGDVFFHPPEDAIGAIFEFYVHEEDKKIIKDNNVPLIKHEDLLDIKLKLNHFNILVVEDDEVAAFCLKDALQEQVKSLQFVENGKEAVAFVKKSKDLQVIIMDIKMPIMNGYEAAEAIRAFNKEVIIIFHSAYAFTEHREKANKSGGDAFLIKPVDTKRLRASIEEVMERRETGIV